ncbi:MAG TPA: CheR family methyltransferase [Acetobacteraceae bacterium]|nr:CheR family methyltransferase [Acetobacteraceae bacterium]
MSAATAADGAFAALAALLRARSGLALTPDKLYLLETRLAPIMRREKLADLSALAARVHRPEADELAREVVEAMTTNESLFFRDDKPFAHLRAKALPALFAARGAGVKLRIWSAAAATGQEAYSIAMILAELAEARGRQVEIVATDICRAALARARAGLYSQFEVQRGLPVQMLVKHFRKEEAGWRIGEGLRAVIEFREWNLLDDLAPLGRFDIVFCRNVLIYFDAETKARVLRAIAARIAPEGFLYLGGAESALGPVEGFAAVADERGVYRRLG